MQGRAKGLLTIDSSFRRALAPILLAGAWLATHWLLRESAIWRDRNTQAVRGAQRDADYAYRRWNLTRARGSGSVSFPQAQGISIASDQ